MYQAVHTPHLASHSKATLHFSSPLSTYKTLSKSSKAFTMVELIFIIVILGILASVAVPRFAASRTDAKAAQLKADIAAIKSAVPAWYVATGNVSIGDAVSLDPTVWGKKNFITYYYPSSSSSSQTNVVPTNACLVVGFSTGYSDMNSGSPVKSTLLTKDKLTKEALGKVYLTINFNENDKSPVCKTVQENINKSDNISLSGGGIKF